MMFLKVNKLDTGKKKKTFPSQDRNLQIFLKASIILNYKRLKIFSLVLGIKEK